MVFVDDLVILSDSPKMGSRRAEDEHAKIGLKVNQEKTEFTTSLPSWQVGLLEGKAAPSRD